MKKKYMVLIHDMDDGWSFLRTCLRGEWKDEEFDSIEEAKDFIKNGNPKCLGNTKITRWYDWDEAFIVEISKKLTRIVKVKKTETIIG